MSVRGIDVEEWARMVSIFDLAVAYKEINKVIKYNEKKEVKR